MKKFCYFTISCLVEKEKVNLVSKPSFCRKDVKLLSSVQKVIPIIKLSYFASAISSQTFCSFWKKVTNSPRPCKKIFETQGMSMGQKNLSPTWG